MKKIMALAMAMAFTAATIGVAHSLTCEVKSVEGTAVTLDCKDIAKSKIEAGKTVKVSEKKDKKVEGC
ncbi:MAG: hypothetical protein PHI06_05855 [Desulfobulbaceae bacterium]|nr:hypothetical protein [Desulfobulbaceae bacterium]